MKKSKSQKQSPEHSPSNEQIPENTTPLKTTFTLSAETIDTPSDEPLTKEEFWEALQSEYNIFDGEKELMDALAKEIREQIDNAILDRLLGKLGNNDEKEQ